MLRENCHVLFISSSCQQAATLTYRRKGILQTHYHTQIKSTLMNKTYIIATSLSVASLHAYAQTETNDNDSIYKETDLSEVSVTARRSGLTRMAGAFNGVTLNKEELFKAACCNLGESFTTNPSVDVAYNDATTGAKQIKLLGLSGTYVQMLTENMPDFRGAATPYALGYVPGPWMKAIQVSKGSASVKNGYESITGQINVDYLKPDDEQGATVNLYGDSKSRIETNADANIHVNEKLSTEVLMHYENSNENHDDNDDGFYDKPKVEQYNLQSRWKYVAGNYIMHSGVTAMKENRNGGEMQHDGNMNMTGHEQYNISIHTDRYSGYTKHAFILDKEHGSNIALMASASMHFMDALYGWKTYSVNEKNVYASLMYETNFSPMHNLSAGVSYNHDYLGQTINPGYNVNYATPLSNGSFYLKERENTPGIYAQYTYTLGTRLTAMAGLRYDHSSVYGGFVTPRFHVKYSPTDIVTLRLSAGKGYRTVFAWAENNYLLASGRQLTVSSDLKQEEAWNYGISSAFYIPLAGKTLKVNAEYYYTRFSNQAVVDYDSDRNVISIDNLHGKSYSHTFQIDATYPLLKGLEITAAYRLNDVKTTFGGTLREKPLTSRYKGLLTASYKTPLGLWQFDATLQLNGGGRNPKPYTLADGTPSWDSSFPAYEQLSAQITRWFRHWSIYIGGENLTGYKQKTSIYGTSNPWGKDFEPTLVWGPVHGRMVYAGVRINIGRTNSL